MRELKYSTKAGEKIYDKASHWAGNTLSQVYKSWSKAKEDAFNWCYEQYLNTEDCDAFSICSFNTFGFACSWLGKKDGENVLRYETKDNSYIVWLDR